MPFVEHETGDIVMEDVTGEAESENSLVSTPSTELEFNDFELNFLAQR